MKGKLNECFRQTIAVLSASIYLEASRSWISKLFFMSLPSDSQFQVIVPDPWSTLRGYETNPVESTHSTLAAAESRCQEIVVRELRSRLEQEMTWTEALRD